MRAVYILICLFSKLHSQNTTYENVLPTSLKWSYYVVPFQKGDTNLLNLKDGKWVDTSINNRIFVFQIKNNLLNGLVWELDKNNNKLRETQFQNGKVTGVDKFFINGKLSRYELREDGSSIETRTYYSNEQIKQIGITRLDTFYTPRVYVTNYYENGFIKSTGEQTTDVENGLWNYFHLNGKTETIGWFNYGVKIGRWSTFNFEGRIIKTEFYKYQGELIDKQEWDYIEENGKVKQIHRK